MAEVVSIYHFHVVVVTVVVVDEGYGRYKPAEEEHHCIFVGLEEELMVYVVVVLEG